MPHVLKSLRLLPVLALSAAGAAEAAERPALQDRAFQSFLEDFVAGTEAFMNGDTAPWKRNVSRRDDTMIMGAWGAFEQGWPAVSARYDWAGRRFEPGDAKLRIEYLTAAMDGDLAFTVAIERAEVKLAGLEKKAPMALRVTHIFRREDGEWKLILRHADPLVAKTSVDSVLD